MQIFQTSNHKVLPKNRKYKSRLKIQLKLVLSASISILGDASERCFCIKCKRFISFVRVHDMKLIRDPKINRKESHKIVSFFPKAYSLKVSKSCQHSTSILLLFFSSASVTSKEWNERNSKGLLFYCALLHTNHFVKRLGNSISLV